jgi:hypothetical protein
MSNGDSALALVAGRERVQRRQDGVRARQPLPSARNPPSLAERSVMRGSLTWKSPPFRSVAPQPSCSCSRSWTILVNPAQSRFSVPSRKSIDGQGWWNLIPGTPPAEGSHTHTEHPRELMRTDDERSFDHTHSIARTARQPRPGDQVRRRRCHNMRRDSVTAELGTFCSC